MKKYEYKIKNLDCPNCANKIETNLNKNEKLKEVIVNFNTLKLSYKTDELTKEDVEKIVKSIMPNVELLEINEQKQENTAKTKIQVIRLLIGIVIAFTGFFSGLPNVIRHVLIIIGYLILLYRTIGNAIKIFKQSKSINENFLVTVSCVGAYLIGEHMEGLMVIILYEIGKILEEKAINKTRKSISDLMNIKPEYANVKRDDGIKQVDPNEVKIGDILVIKKGEKVPLDGVILTGNAELDVSSLTGESKLKVVKEESEVLSGSIVIDGTFEMKVTLSYENSTVSKILELVENATDKKAKTETFVAKAARIYSPAVLGLAILIALILPIFTSINYFGDSGSVYRALIFLVISCPCAIAISVPLSYFSGIGKSSKEGILIKGSDYLDSVKDIKEIVFDKTGTLTKGEFEITNIEVYEEALSKEEILKYVVLGEQYSNHPIAKSIIKSARMNPKEEIEEYKEISGKGISYIINNKQVLIGNGSLVENKTKEDETTKIYVKINDKLVGAICLEDIIKEDTKEALEELKKIGIKTRMFTGDNKKVALKIAKQLEIDEVKYEMLPSDKYKELENILDTYKNTKDKVAFVGDGINDSPVLALSDIGISMGGIGAESAVEASDIVIMTDSIKKIKEAILISKKTNRIIKQDLIFAITTKLAVLILSTLGITVMWQAVFADVGVTLINILNTLRILKD